MMRRRSVLRTLAVGTVGASAGCVSHPLSPLRGTVTRKRVVSGGRTLVAVTESRITVHDSGLRESLPHEERGNTSVTGEMSRRLRDEYDGVGCRVTIRHENANHIDGVGAGETESYRASRNTFNQVMVGDDLTFQIGVVNRPNLLNPGEIVRSGRVERKRLVGRKRSGRKDRSEGAGLLGFLGKNEESNGATTETRLLTVTANKADASRDALDGKRRIGSDLAESMREEFDALVFRASMSHGNGRRRTYEFGSNQETGRKTFNRTQIGGQTAFEIGGEYGNRLVAFAG